ncbi:MAG: ABC transporter permease [Acidimicrobiia bacterium]
MSSVDARIVDRGYRAYDGPRLGARGAMRSAIRHTERRVMGIRRPARAKVLPVLSAVIAYVPAIVFVGVAALITDKSARRSFIPTYGEYYGYIASALMLFTAFVAPDALCPDRKTGLLGMYLAAPLTRARYVVAKVIAVARLLAIACVGPPLLMLVAFILQGLGPDGPGDIAILLVRILVAGLTLTGVYAAVSLGISSLTDRKAFASAGVILLLLITGAITGTLVGGLKLPDWILVFNLSGSPFQLVLRIYGQRGDIPAVGTWALVAANLGWVVAGFGTLVWRYSRLEVTK